MLRWVVVAHPDDEVIFAGGAILSHPDDAWTVVIATWAADSPRAAEALTARDELRSRGIQIDYRFLGHDDVHSDPKGGIDVWKLARQLKQLGVETGERVYTHGESGEYGHKGHKAVHWAVEVALGRTAAVSTFSGDGALLECIADPDLLNAKIRLFDEAYPSQELVWTKLAPTMLQAAREERHVALPALDAALPEAAASGPRRSVGDAPGLDGRALARAIRKQIDASPAIRDALVIGLDEAVDLAALRSKVSGRIDVIDHAPEADAAVAGHQGAEIVAPDFFLWDPAARRYDLILWVGSLQRVRDFATAFELAAKLMRPGAQLILTHEPLIEGHPSYGAERSAAGPTIYRRPTQLVLDLARRGGMRIRLLKDLFMTDRGQEPVMRQLVHLQLR